MARSQIVGRVEQREHLRRVLDETRAGEKRTVLLLGPPGSGKTALLQWVESLSGSELSVILRAPLAATSPPGFPARQVLDALAGSNSDSIASRELLADINTLREEPAIDALRLSEVLNNVSRDRVLVVLFDDIQWAPPEGLAVLTSAMRLTERPLFMVATQRISHGVTKHEPPLLSTSADLPLDQIELDGLTVGDVRQIAEEAIGTPVVPSLANELHRQTQGNPLFVLEALRSLLSRNEIVRIPGGYASIAEEGYSRLSRSVDETIESRLLELPLEDLNLLAALAAIGRDCGLDELTDFTEKSLESLVDPIAGLQRAGFVVFDAATPRRVRLAHPLYRDAALRAVGSARTAWWHQRIYRWLTTYDDADAREIAHHAARCLEPPARLTELLRTAADKALDSRSYREATQWFEELSRQANLAYGERIAALEGMAASLEHTDPGKAIDVYSDALKQFIERHQRVVLLRGRASAYRKMGRIEEALTDLEQAEHLGDATEQFQIRDAKAVALGISGDVESAERLLRQLASESSNAEEYARATGHLALIAYTRGDLEEAADLLKSAIEACSDPEYVAYLRMNLAWLLSLIGDWGEAWDLLETGTAEARSAGDVWILFSLIASATKVAAWKGDLGRAIDDGVYALRLIETIPSATERIIAIDSLGGALIENESYEDAVNLLQELWTLASKTPEVLDMASGMLLLGEAHLMLGQVEEAARACSEARRYLWTNAAWTASADRLAAQISLAQGDGASCLRRLEPWRSTPSPIAFERARIQEVIARAYAQAGDNQAALEEAHSALGLYQHLGANLRATRMLAWIGDHTSRPPGRPRITQPGELTGREREILELIRDGLTNREVAEILNISPGTVKKHVENMKMKLGARRRTELAAYPVRTS